MRAGYCDTTTSPEVERVVFRFQINGTSNPDNLLPAFQGITDVTRTGVGVFAAVTETKYPTFIGAKGSVLEATPAHDLIVKFSATAYNTTTGVLTMTVVGADGSTAAEDPVDNDWVFVEAFFGRKSGMHASGAI